MCKKNSNTSSILIVTTNLNRKQNLNFILSLYIVYIILSANGQVPITILGLFLIIIKKRITQVLLDIGKKTSY